MFYVIQATPDGVSLEKVRGANKQVPRENQLSGARVGVQAVLLCSWHGAGSLSGPEGGGAQVLSFMEGQWVHSVSAPLELRTVTEKELCGLCKGSWDECSDVEGLELLTPALGM